MLEKEVITEKKKMGFGLLTLITIAAIAVVIAGIVLVMRMMGKSNIYATVAGTETADLGESTDQELEDNQILYDGQVYALNEDMITILVMGIDKESVYDIGGQSWSADEEGEYAGGQADALFLMLINPHDENVYVIAINRNSMVDVDVFDEDGNYEGRYIKQVALQHGYGDGQEESCERQVKTVSRMFHNIPINDYVAISMDAIPELNDLLGGIEVEVLDDIVYPEYDMDLHQGETVTLYGEQAYWYVRLRNEDVFNSNEQRLQRQKQYLTTFAAKAKNEASSDIRVAVSLYQTAQKYMVTDIDLSSFTYLATEALGYEFDVEHMYSLEGETVQGNNFEEFYVDDDALQQLIIDLFYEPAEEN
jgi:LCP family protein required for cell wall assembly